jgi:hypothetical protein
LRRRHRKGHAGLSAARSQPPNSMVGGIFMNFA